MIWQIKGLETSNRNSSGAEAGGDYAWLSSSLERRPEACWIPGEPRSVRQWLRMFATKV